jgi:filamentous hemagglutinin family protein
MKNLPTSKTTTHFKVRGAVLLALALTHSVTYAELIPHNSTATSVATGANGQALVNIAPPVAGVSHNAYVDFSVDKAGLEFINTGVGARQIVNEVVSTRPSLIEGSITVLGPRANVIIANPNGISVNGASFVNTGNVALSTGRVQFNDFDVAPGVPQRNVVLTTNQGAIEVGPGGLSGAFNSLELIAKQLRINGPVTNTVSRADTRIRVVAGESKAEIDTSVSPTDNLTPWIAYDGTAAAGAGAVLVDITPLGSLTAGSIQIAVTERGAGVRHAGEMYATVGDFTLNATGEVKLVGGGVRAARHVVVNAGSLALEAATQSARLVSDGGSLVIKSDGGVALVGSELAARGDIMLSAASFAQRNAGELASKTIAAEGAVRIDVSGDVRNTGSLVQGNAAGTDGAAVAIKSGGSIYNASDDAAAQPAVIYAGAGDVLLEAKGDIRNDSARVLATSNLMLRADGDVMNSIQRSGDVASGEVQSYRKHDHNWLGLPVRESGFTVNYGQLTGTHTEAFLKASNDVVIKASNIANNGGNIYADTGDVRLDAAQRIDNAGVAIGSAHFERKCNVLFCRAKASSDVNVAGGEISAAHDIVFTAGEEILNAGGRVLALNDMTLNAPKVSARGIAGYTSIDREKGMKSWFGDTWAQIYAADVGGSFRANGGKLTINGTGYAEGATFNAAQGVEASGGVIEVRPVRRDPVVIRGNRIGVISWFD